MLENTNKYNGASSLRDGRYTANAKGQTTLSTKGYLLIGDSAFIGKVLLQINPQKKGLEND